MNEGYTFSTIRLAAADSETADPSAFASVGMTKGRAVQSRLLGENCERSKRSCEATQVKITLGQLFLMEPC
ncbi:MAG: hypothetical protein QOJ42_6298 [Acidobacteriaceae bacterium]|nr:hypothetical protein [Acidobacteriaceae bacterium]